MIYNIIETLYTMDNDIEYDIITTYTISYSMIETSRILYLMDDDIQYDIDNTYL